MAANDPIFLCDRWCLAGIRDFWQFFLRRLRRQGRVVYTSYSIYQFYKTSEIMFFDILHVFNFPFGCIFEAFFGWILVILAMPNPKFPALRASWEPPPKSGGGRGSPWTPPSPSILEGVPPDTPHPLLAFPSKPAPPSAR